ncbi:unnamed protein product, partial [Tilletia laevis]
MPEAGEQVPAAIQAPPNQQAPEQALGGQPADIEAQPAAGAAAAPGAQADDRINAEAAAAAAANQADPQPAAAAAQEEPRPIDQVGADPQAQPQARQQSPVDQPRPEGDNFEHTPEQLQEAESLLNNRKAWLEELAPDLDKKGRKEATEMAHGIIFTSQNTAKDALEMALHHIGMRVHIQTAVGKDLNPSSDIPSEPDQAPAPSAIKLALPKASKKRKSKGKGKKPAKKKSKRRRLDSSDTESSSGSSSSESSSGDSNSDSDSDQDTSSDEDDTKWKPGKRNQQVWGAMNVPDRIAKKVDKGEYVDMWWFTPTALSMKHKDKKKVLTVQGGELRAAEPSNPAEFTEDESIPWDDFLFAIDKWTETMKAEDIGKKTRSAWNSFNTAVRKHMDRQEPLVRQSLQMLHAWQRKCFAHDTRQTKTRR